MEQVEKPAEAAVEDSTVGDPAKTEAAPGAADEILTTGQDPLAKAVEVSADAPPPQTGISANEEVKAETGGAEEGQGFKGPGEGEEGAAPFNTVLDFLSSLLTKNYKEALRLSKNILKYEPKNKTVAEFLNVLEEVVAGGLLEDSECSSSEDSSDASSGSESSESEDSSGSSEESSDEEEERSLAFLEAETRTKHCGPEVDLESVLTTPSTVCKCKCRRHRHHEEPAAGRHSKKQYGHAPAPTTATRVHKNSHRNQHNNHENHLQHHHNHHEHQHRHHVHERDFHDPPPHSRHPPFTRVNSAGTSVMTETTGFSGATEMFMDGCGESSSRIADNEFLTAGAVSSSGQTSRESPPQNHHCCCAHHHHHNHHDQHQQQNHHHRRHQCSKAALLRSMESRLNTPQVRNCLLRNAPDEQEAAMMRRALWAVAEAATFDSCGGGAGGGNDEFVPAAFDASMLGLAGSRLCSPEPTAVHQMDHPHHHSFGLMMPPEDLQSMGSFRIGSGNNSGASSSSSSSSRNGLPSPSGFGEEFHQQEGESQYDGSEVHFGQRYEQHSFGGSLSMSTFDEEDDLEEDEDDDDDGDTYNVGVLGAMPAPPLKSILKGSSGCPRHRFFRDEVRFDESALMARGAGSTSSSCSTASNTTDDGYSS